MFLLIISITVICQVIIVEFGGEIFRTTKLSWDQWLICVAIGFLSLPFGLILRLIPDCRKPKPPPPPPPVVTREKVSFFFFLIFILNLVSLN